MLPLQLIYQGLLLGAVFFQLLYTLAHAVDLIVKLVQLGIFFIDLFFHLLGTLIGRFRSLILYLFTFT